MSTTYLSDWRDKRIASLERQLEDAKAQFRAETLRTSEYAVMIDKMIARLCVEHEPGAWSRSCESCALVLEARALRMKPININPLAEMQAQLAERTRERDRARSYCAELASYVCEPIYDDVRNRAGIAADASAAAGDEMSMRWHDVQRAQARAESAERALAEARKDAERLRDALREYRNAQFSIKGDIVADDYDAMALRFSRAQDAVDEILASEKGERT